MSKAEDELFGLKSSRTGEYLHSESADEMFKELGYEKDLHIDRKEQVWGEYFYNKRLDTLISFDYIDKGLCCSTKGKNAEPIYINMQELQAINLKVKELRLDRRRK